MLVVAVELVSGLLSLACGFPLCSLMPALSITAGLFWHDCHPSLRPPGQMSTVFRLSMREICWNQCLGFLNSHNPCVLALVHLRLCLL